MSGMVIALIVAAAGTCLVIVGIETHRLWLVRYQLPAPKPLPAADAEWLAILQAMNHDDPLPAGMVERTLVRTREYAGRHRREVGVNR